MKDMEILKTLSAVSLMLVSLGAAAQNSNGAAWSETIERALAAHGISASAATDLKGGTPTLHLSIDGKTVQEPVMSMTSVPDYSSPVYVIIDGIESRMRYMYPVGGAVKSQVRPSGGITASSRSHGGQMQSRPQEMMRQYDPVRDWHARSSSYMPDEVYEDIRDLDLLESAIETGVSDAVRVSLVDPAYARSIPAEQQVLLLRVRVIDLQRGDVYEKPKEGTPAGTAPKLSRRMAYANVNIQLVDDMTGVVVWQDNIDSSDNTIIVREDPMMDCISGIKRAVTNALNELYPYVAPRLSVEGRMTALASSSKQKANTVFIDLGSDHELKAGDYLTVYRQQSVGGNAGLTQIGTVSVSEIQGPSLSLCKVRKGEKEIFTALSAGDVLVVRTNW